MSISKTPHIASSSYTRFLRPALVVAALVVGTASLHAADTTAATKGAQQEGSVNSQRNVGDTDGQLNTPNGNINADNVAGNAATDASITRKVQSEIVASNAAQGYRVRVSTKRGVVSLKGKLPSQEAADQVKSIAANVAGVQGVDTSGLTVQG